MQRAGIWLLQVLLLTMPAAAQQISTHANLVPVPTLVLDGQGNTIFGLHAQDFLIKDDGLQQVVHLDKDAESKSLSLMLRCSVAGEQAGSSAASARSQPCLTLF